MTLILATAFIAITALALPNPTNSILPRDFPEPLGRNQGSPFTALTFTIYEEPHCKGEPAGTYTGSYGFYEAHQMQSYRLTRTLTIHEVLDFYSGSATDLTVNNTHDPTKNGHYTEACWLYDATAGINATEKDQATGGGGHNGKTAGCHTLNKNEWCAILWLP
ncbi:hypothetical protein HO133_006959 [Letharia lupina]|uniref:Uncharacterized protein n=1 Tax=Letharia lupina TaxID=560253 RepID=A0A8H6CSR0_9LECA|nr:uncharacterized protein HO133_006959 [Letharia lupina]KAF6228848.1 hypothetical protein HO133_006959 [Letharia lupina]